MKTLNSNAYSTNLKLVPIMLYCRNHLLKFERFKICRIFRVVNQPYEHLIPSIIENHYQQYPQIRRSKKVDRPNNLTLNSLKRCVPSLRPIVIKQLFYYYVKIGFGLFNSITNWIDPSRFYQPWLEYINYWYKIT